MHCLLNSSPYVVIISFWIWDLTIWIEMCMYNIHTYIRYMYVCVYIYVCMLTTQHKSLFKIPGTGNLWHGDYPFEAESIINLLPSFSSQQWGILSPLHLPDYCYLKLKINKGCVFKDKFGDPFWRNTAKTLTLMYI